MKESYNSGVTDEFLIPFVCVDSRGEPVGTIRDEDAVHQLQLPRRPRAADYPLLARESGITKQGGRDLRTPLRWTRRFRAAKSRRT